MTSTDIKIGLTNSARPSSRVLKPPGGGHSNIFSNPEVSVNAPRPKYNQQNSSNLNACMGSTDPNQKVEKLRNEITHLKDLPKESIPSPANVSFNEVTSRHESIGGGDVNKINESTRGRVPPGGYSSGGFW